MKLISTRPHGAITMQHAKNCLQRLPESHAGPKIYRHVNASVIIYLLHCGISVTQQKPQKWGCGIRKLYIHFLYSIRLPVSLNICYLHALTLPKKVHMPSASLQQALISASSIAARPWHATGRGSAFLAPWPEHSSMNNTVEERIGNSNTVF